MQYVQIVRPDKGIRESFVDLGYSLILLALRAWVVMLLAPTVWRPVGYWWAVAAVIVVGTLTSSAADHRLWTRAER